LFQTDWNYKTELVIFSPLSPSCHPGRSLAFGLLRFPYPFDLFLLTSASYIHPIHGP
jgi:hypothetical protein